MSFIGPVQGGARISFGLDHEKFDASVKQFIAAYRDGAEQAVKRTGFELLRRTILRTTRVDTGRMRNGWHVSFHRPSDWVAPPRKKNDPQTPPPDPGNDEGVRVLYVQNNVWYAPLHEFGTSRISPLLMLTISVQEMSGELDRYLMEGIEPTWNKEINGMGGEGLAAAGQVTKEEFLRRFEEGPGAVGARRQRPEFRPRRSGSGGKKGR